MTARQWVVIGTSAYVDTSVACGPYGSAEEALNVSAELDAKGWVSELCMLYAVGEIVPVGGEEPGPDAVTLHIPGALAALLYRSDRLAGAGGRAFRAAPVIGWGSRGGYSVAVSASPDVHQDLVEAARWALDDEGGGSVAARRAFAKYRNRVRGVA